MHIRENGRLVRNVKLFENLPYVLAHSGIDGSTWSNTHSQNFKDFGKVSPKWEKKKAENGGDAPQKVCEVADTSFVEKWGENLKESVERKIILSGGSSELAVADRSFIIGVRRQMWATELSAGVMQQWTKKMKNQWEESKICLEDYKFSLGCSKIDITKIWQEDSFELDVKNLHLKSDIVIVIIIVVNIIIIMFVTIMFVS